MLIAATACGGDDSTGSSDSSASMSGEQRAELLGSEDPATGEPVPAGGGATFRCGGSAVPSLPAVCTNQWLRTTLDAEGRPSGYQVEDSSDILEGL